MSEATGGEMGTAIANHILERTGCSGTRALDLAMGIQLGTLIATQHPEWAAALALDTPGDGGEELADSIVEGVPIEIMQGPDVARSGA